jgi:hypothetical protein
MFMSLMALAGLPAATWAKPQIKDAGTIQLTAQAKSPKGQTWTLNANESKAKDPALLYNRELVGPANDKTLAIMNNTKSGVAGLVLHYHSDEPIKAFTWQMRQVFVQAGATNTDQFFIGWTTDKVGAFGNTPINPAQFKAVETLTLSGPIKKVLEFPKFSVKDIDSSDVYIFIGRNDINPKGDSENIFFNLSSSFGPEDRKNSFFRIDE